MRKNKIASEREREGERKFDQNEMVWEDQIPRLGFEKKTKSSVRERDQDEMGWEDKGAI